MLSPHALAEVHPKSVAGPYQEGSGSSRVPTIISQPPHSHPNRGCSIREPELDACDPQTDRECSLSRDRLSQEYFAVPFQWWDDRDDKRNPKAPDFRHKTSKEMLWIDGCLLEEKDAENGASHPVNGGKASGRYSKQGQGCVNSEDPGYGHMDKASFKSGVQVDAQLYQQGNGWDLLSLEQALSVLEGMAELPAAENLRSILQKCRKEKNLAYVKRVQAHVCNKGLEANKALGNYMVPTFVECGSVSDAQQVFDGLTYRNEHSWTSLVLGYVQCGQAHNALNLSSYTLMALLKACGRLKDVKRGQKIHAEISQKGLENLFLGSALIDMYAKCGLLSEAQEVLEKLPVRNVVSWNALIGGYAEQGPFQEALNCFRQMHGEGICPDATTFSSVFKACGTMGALSKGLEIHVEVAQKRFERDIFVGSSLVDMYAKCGSLSEAREVFDKLPVRNVVSWSALIAGYAEHGPVQKALECFEQMQRQGISPDACTFVCVLKACGYMGAIVKGREIHAQIKRKRLERDLFVCSSLVDMYAKCGSLSEAQKVFDKLPVRNVVSWSALIAGYAEHGPCNEALKHFEQMQSEGISPDVVALTCALRACGSMGALGKGREIHAKVAQKGFGTDLSIINTLVDMYAKCGSLSEAWEVFDNMPVRDVVSWNTMLKGYGMNHEATMAVEFFEDLPEQGMKPDDITFTSVLSACSHANLILRGQEYFNLMRRDYGITPTAQHYTCMVDLLARSGHLYEAEEFLQMMWCAPSEETQTALLSACKIYGEAGLGSSCFQQLVKVNPESVASYVLMANIYANAGRRDDAHKVEKRRKHTGTKKPQASAIMEVNNRVHEFVVGNNQSEEFLEMLENWRLQMKGEVYVTNLNLLLRPNPCKEEGALCGHAEKLAIAFGLISTEQDQMLRITKNFKMCNNCHDVSKIISRTERREIMIRDDCCIHHFKGGLCSCRDVW